MKISERDISDLRHGINNARKRQYYARAADTKILLVNAQ